MVATLKTAHDGVFNLPNWLVIARRYLTGSQRRAVEWVRF